MNVYLVHEPLIRYIVWLRVGTLQWPKDLTCSSATDKLACLNELETFNKARQMPAWGVLVVLPVSLVLAWVLHHAVEKPFRHLLKAKEV
jgi:peptidoglycan/LPS O-acetylase OafA/YrhL